MKSLLPFFVACFATLAASCLPPGIPFNIAHNRTLLKELTKKHEGGPETRWLHAVAQDAPLQRWPRGKDSSRPDFVTFPYCFAKEEFKSFHVRGVGEYKTKGILENAWNMWEHRLGAPSEAHQHRLAGFKEFAKDGRYPLCRNVDGSWNQDVPGDTIVVEHEGPVGSAHASMGYFPPGVFRDAGDEHTGNGRHGITIGAEVPNPDAWSSTTITHMISQVAHEIGHILGFDHEHQREDRDYFVHFDCTALARYEETKQKVESEAEYTMEQVCSSRTMGIDYDDFLATQYAKEGEWLYGMDGDYLDYIYTRSMGYDLQSIMHYSGAQGAVPGGRHVLRKWKKTYSQTDRPPAEATPENSDEIQYNWIPSPLDTGAVKQLYPW